MNTRDFIYYLVSRGRQLVKYDPSSQFRPDISTLSELFTWPCDFKDGGCAAERKSPKCCCKNCVLCVGYLGNEWPNRLHTLSFYAKHFTAKNGFWRPGKGCILPREKRSLTCAFYVCNERHEEFIKRNPKDIVELYHRIMDFTSAENMYGGRGGEYEEDFIRTENKLREEIEKFLWNRNLYYDGFRRHRLLKILKKKQTSKNRYEMEVEGLGKVVSNGWVTSITPIKPKPMHDER